MNAVRPMLVRSLLGNGLLAVAVALVGGTIGFLVADGPGLAGALVGAAIAALFMGLTAGSILLATAVSRGQMVSAAFFGIVMGGFLVKLVVFVLLMLALRGAAWLDPYVFFVTVLVAVVGNLAVDVYAFVSARVPYVSDIAMPEAPAAED